jgi:nucleoid-associated protein YgaU
MQAGETVSQIAAESYNDPARWRAIADENNLFDPLNVPPGTLLSVPAITA